jgi:DNA-binding LacI/PurR family transcriptional regulator
MAGNPPTEPVRLAQIAESAGVSKATVSRVLNNKAGVAAKTRALVEQAVRELGPVQQSRHEVVLLLTPGLRNPFFARMCESIHDELGGYGLHPVICRSKAGSREEREQLIFFAELGLAGAIFLSSPNVLHAEQLENRRLLQQRRVPFVCLNGSFDGLDAPVFSTDHVASSELAVAHLWSLGHRAIAFIAGPDGIRGSDRRLAGFRRAMTGRDVADHDLSVVRNEYSSEGGRAAVAELLADHPGVTAIVAANDQIAFGAIEALREHGRAVPAEVSIVGYDDSELLDYTDPPLTTVRQPSEILSHKIVQTVLRQVSGQTVEPTEVLVRPELRVRASTALPITLARAAGRARS